MSVAELKKDVEEIVGLLAQTKRQRIKNLLSIEKHQIETLIINLSAKEQGEKDNEARASEAGSSQNRYCVELKEYAWDESDKYVKLYVTLDGVQNLPETQITTTFTNRSVVLRIKGLKNKDYELTINNLLTNINPEGSYHKIKTEMVTVYMKKKRDGELWSCLTTIEKRLKDKEEDDMDTELDGREALVDIMKRLLKSDDPKAKKIIANAWRESVERREKNSSSN